MVNNLKDEKAGAYRKTSLSLVQYYCLDRTA